MLFSCIIFTRFEDLDNPNMFKVNIEAICGDEFSFNHAVCQCF